jgi:hypothetical protein
MPRPNDRDEYDRDDPRPRPKKSNTGLIIGLVVGGGLLMLLVCGGALVLLGWVAMPRGAMQQNPPADATAVQPAGKAELVAAPEPAAKPPAARPSMSRAAFETAVRGRTRDEVIAAVGRPDETRERVPGEVLRGAGPLGGNITLQYDWWHFHDRVTNDATAKPYTLVRVRFSYDGKADRFEYQ